MDKTNGQTKKCFCARCFLPIDIEDKVDIENQNFHRICSMCCICRTIPSSLKMFYGHVFCGDCFKNHVMTRFRGEGPRMQSNSWWMQWAPGCSSREASEQKDEEIKTAENAEEPPKRHICSRCLQVVNEDGKIDIAGQSFHAHCAKCYFCHTVPTSQPKIYYGQLFCEECFHTHVIGRSRDNPSEFFKTCFEQWQSNPQFADNMREFMAGGSNTPFVFMMQGQQPPFCRCGTNPQDSSWFQSNEPKKCA
ncbi:hypothetical protein K1T71_000902 [Dendrolimus kikuchii]|uniref:Uncharacterized protein n=1 Tax=Dendrolimus kikuchii TaxID=765133 RepID=A0ACC1DHP8_9NEOP|nr:hypothetical protein K1T71_000902 [Dendrolimus kikuchii]